MYLRGDVESIYTELALYWSKDESARTNNVFLPISEVCNGMVSLAEKKAYWVRGRGVRP